MEPGREGLDLADTCLDPKKLKLASNLELRMILIGQSMQFMAVRWLRLLSVIPAPF